MSNKIQGYGTQLPSVAGGTRTVPVDRVASESQKVDQVRPTGDSVTLTESARQLQKLSETIAATPVVDNVRVEAVKTAISQGSYEVNAERVADKLLAANRELPGR